MHKIPKRYIYIYILLDSSHCAKSDKDQLLKELLEYKKSQENTKKTKRGVTIGVLATLGVIGTMGACCFIAVNNMCCYRSRRERLDKLYKQEREESERKYQMERAASSTGSHQSSSEDAAKDAKANIVMVETLIKKYKHRVFEGCEMDDELIKIGRQRMKEKFDSARTKNILKDYDYDGSKALGSEYSDFLSSSVYWSVIDAEKHRAASAYPELTPTFKKWMDIMYKMDSDDELTQSDRQTYKDSFVEVIKISDIKDAIGDFKGMSTDFIVKCINEEKQANDIQAEIAKDLQACFTDKLISLLTNTTASNGYEIDCDKLKKNPDTRSQRENIGRQIKNFIDIFKDQIPEIMWMESVSKMSSTIIRDKGLIFFKEIYKITDFNYKEVIKNAIKQIYVGAGAVTRIDKEFIIEFITKQKTAKDMIDAMQIEKFKKLSNPELEFLKELDINIDGVRAILNLQCTEEKGINCLKEIKQLKNGRFSETELWKVIENPLRAIANDISDPSIENLNDVTNQSKIKEQFLASLQKCYPMFAEKSVDEIHKFLKDLKKLGIENDETEKALGMCEMIKTTITLDGISSIGLLPKDEVEQAAQSIKDGITDIKMPVSLKKAVCDLIANNQLFGYLQEAMAKIIRDCLPAFKSLTLNDIKSKIIFLKTCIEDAGIIAILDKIEEYFALYKALDKDKQGIEGINYQSYSIKNDKCFQILRDVLQEIIRDAKPPSLIDGAFAEGLINGQKTVGDVVEQFNVMKCICSDVESVATGKAAGENLLNVVSVIKKFIDEADKQNKDKFNKLHTFAYNYCRLTKDYENILGMKGWIVIRRVILTDSYFSNVAISTIDKKLSSIEKTPYDKLTVELIEMHENLSLLIGHRHKVTLWNGIFADIDIRIACMMYRDPYNFLKENINRKVSFQELKEKIRRECGLSAGGYANHENFFEGFNFKDFNFKDFFNSGKNPSANPSQPPKLQRPPEIVAALEEACANIGKIDKLAGEVIKEIGAGNLKGKGKEVKKKIQEAWKVKEREILNSRDGAADKESKMFGTNVYSQYQLAVRGIFQWCILQNRTGCTIKFDVFDYSDEFWKAMPNLYFIQNAI